MKRHKIVTLPRLLDLRRAWRQKRQKVVFTNGCFDLLHPGHIRTLEKARSQGDVLVLGLNTDASVRRLKGRSRPIQDERARAEVMSALECVDAVVLFGEETPAKLIALLKPDILVKGADYAEDEIVGRENAGKVVRVPLAPNHSTTRLIERIRKGRGF